MPGTLIILGVIIIAAGLLWPWLTKIPIARLPGDIIINKPGFKIYIPITTMIVASLLITLVSWLFRK
jgi:hypothetical protein